MQEELKLEEASSNEAIAKTTRIEQHQMQLAEESTFAAFSFISPFIQFFMVNTINFNINQERKYKAQFTIISQEYLH